MLGAVVAQPEEPARGASPRSQPEEIVNAALFPLSDEASFVTGSIVAVDGGSTA